MDITDSPASVDTVAVFLSCRVVEAFSFRTDYHNETWLVVSFGVESWIDFARLIFIFSFANSLPKRWRLRALAQSPEASNYSFD